MSCKQRISYDYIIFFVAEQTKEVFLSSVNIAYACFQCRFSAGKLELEESYKKTIKKAMAYSRLTYLRKQKEKNEPIKSYVSTYYRYIYLRWIVVLITSFYLPKRFLYFLKCHNLFTYVCIKSSIHFICDFVSIIKQPHVLIKMAASHFS